MTTQTREKVYMIVIAICFLLVVVFFVYAYIQRISARTQILYSSEMVERYHEADLHAQELKEELYQLRQTLREKDSIISVLTKTRK